MTTTSTSSFEESSLAKHQVHKPFDDSNLAKPQELKPIKELNPTTPQDLKLFDESNLSKPQDLKRQKPSSNGELTKQHPASNKISVNDQSEDLVQRPQ